MNIITLLLGIVLIYFGYSSFKKSRKLSKDGVRTMAKIISVEKKKDRDAEGYTTNSYYPVLEFITSDKKTHTFNSNVSSQSKRKYKIGQEIEIIYDPDQPQQACVKSFGSMWLVPGIVILAGLMLIFGSIFAKF